MPEAVETETPSLATSEYADSRGRSEAKRLARDILVNPSVTIFSKEPLNIDPLAPGGGAQQPADDAVFIIPDDNDVRIQLTRGADNAPSVESTAKGQLAFTC